MKKILFLLILILMPVLATQAQVTIGGQNMPQSFSVLELISNKGKGLRLPQMTTFQRDSITTAAFKANPLATGLIIMNIDSECEELWNGEEWKSICGTMGNAEFAPVNCSDIKVNGAYIEQAATTTGNFLTIKLNVTKAGVYNITAMTDNGYSFFVSGTALSLGEMLVNVPCQGTPQLVQTDDLAFTGVELLTGCVPKVTVASAVAEYSLDCATLAVTGRYLKGTALTSANTITLSIRVTKTGSYHITTVPASGISFSKSDKFETVGTHLVTLSGSGTPTVNEDIMVKIQANTLAGNASCEVTVPITLPVMTYALIGMDLIYSWNGARKTALENGTSFGINGVVKTLGLQNIWETNVAATAIGKLTSNVPDIVFYFAYGAPNSTALSAALANYVNKGGVLIYASNSEGENTPNGTGLVNTKILLNGIFGTGNTAAWQSYCNGLISNCPGSFPNDDNDYLIASLHEDPVVNGPFGNLAGKYWGEDNATVGTILVTQLPPNSVQICSANNNWGHTVVNPNYSVVWYNESKNFFMFGDTTGASATITDSGSYPSYFTSAGLPRSKMYGNGNNFGSPYVYNSALELNVVAWAIRKAAVSGINPH